MLKINFKRFFIFLIFTFSVSGYSAEDSVPISQKELLSYHLQKSKEGNPESQYYMYRLYRFGIGVNVDSDEAMKYLTLSASNGYYKSLSLLSKIYRDGFRGKDDFSYGRLVVEKNESLAKKYAVMAFDSLNEAAKSGDLDAIYTLGKYYKSGINGVVEADPLKSVSIFKEYFEEVSSRAQSGDGKYQYVLAKLYEDGSANVIADLDKAWYWYNKSFDSKFYLALWDFALFYKSPSSYEYEKYIDQNMDESVSLLKYLADKSFRKAQSELGDHYANLGEYNTALDWYKKALSQYPNNGLLMGDIIRVYKKTREYEEYLKWSLKLINEDTNLSRQMSEVGNLIAIFQKDGWMTKRYKESPDLYKWEIELRAWYNSLSTINKNDFLNQYIAALDGIASKIGPFEYENNERARAGHILISFLDDDTNHFNIGRKIRHHTESFRYSDRFRFSSACELSDLYNEGFIKSKYQGYMYSRLCLDFSDRDWSRDKYKKRTEDIGDLIESNMIDEFENAVGNKNWQYITDSY